MFARQDRFHTLGELFLQSCDRYADLVAYKYRPRFRTLVWTYRGIEQHALAFADVLEKHGVGKGDRVIIAAYNSPHWVAAFFGIQLRGAVVVPLSPESKPEFFKIIAEQTEAKVFLRSEFVTREGVPVQDVMIEKIPFSLSKRSAFTSLRPTHGQSEPCSGGSPFVGNVGGDDLAEIVYTSGTTGDPKGVMLTHKNLLSNLEASRQAIPVHNSLRFVSILPLFHMFEQMGGMLVPFAAGAQVSYAASLNPNHLNWIFQDDKPSRILAVPEFLRLAQNRLMERAAEQGKEKLLKNMLWFSKHLPMPLRKKLFGEIHHTLAWHMHSIASGGAPLEPEVSAFWEGIGIYILQGYGLTETSPVLTVNTYKDRKLDSVGKPVQGVEIKIAEDGEVLAKGPNIFAGYWRDEEKTKQAFDEEGWYKTGDIGELDKDNHLHLRGRKKFMIVLPTGEKAHPEDIEREINKEEGVIDSVVMGISERGWEQVHAVLLLDPASRRKPEDIVEETNKWLVGYQKVQSFSVWKEADFPRTPTKKVKRHEVKLVIERQMRESKVVEAKFGQAVGGGVRSGDNRALEESGSSPLDILIARVAEVRPEQVSDEKRLIQDLNIDSLKRVELVGRIEVQMNVSVDEGEIGERTTVKQLKEIVAKRVNKQVRYPFQAWHFTKLAAFWRGILFVLFLIPLARLLAPSRVQGVEWLKTISFPAVFYANHSSTVDTGVIYAAFPGNVRRHLATLAATDVIYEEEVWWIAKPRALLEFLFALIPLPRNGGQIKSALEYAGRALDHGYSLLVFPEGQISRGGELLPFKQGAGFLGVEVNVSLVPVKLRSTARVLAPGPVGTPPAWRWPKRANVGVTIGEPFFLPTDISYEAATKEMQRRLREL